MRKLNLTLLGLALSIFSIFSQESHTRQILIFNQGQTTLSSSQKSEIVDIASNLHDGEHISIYPLIGDKLKPSNTAIDITNKSLRSQPNLRFDRKSKQQAQAIAKYAKTIGFEITGTPTNFPYGLRGISACVNMKYIKPKGSPKTEPLAEVKPTIPEGFEPVKDHYPEKRSQFFVIDPNKDTIITGEEGTKLEFEKGSLMSDELVEIELKEFYGIDDYIKGDLLTVSNGKMIQTGGSIFLDAKEEDSRKPVKINQKKGVGVDFTIGKEDPKMEVFMKDARSSETNWIRQTKTVVRSRFRATYTVMRNGKIVDELVFTSKEEWDQFKKELEAKAEQERRETEERRRKLEAELAKRKKLDSKLKILDFGYINCDRFPEEPMMPLMVQADKDVHAEYYLVFKDVRGVMKGSIQSDKVAFGQVPKNKEAVLMAISFIDDQAYFFRANIVPKSNKPQIDLKPVSESYVNQQMAMLK